MSSDIHTPKSVLDAPVSAPIPVSVQPGKNRHSRRHFTLRRNGKVFLISRGARQPATNGPFEKDGD